MYICICIHTYIPTAVTSMNSTTKTQNFRHLQRETFAVKHREIKIVTDSYSQQAPPAIPTTAVLRFYLHYLSKVPIDSHYKWALIITSKSLRKCRHTYQNHFIISFISKVEPVKTIWQTSLVDTATNSFMTWNI